MPAPNPEHLIEQAERLINLPQAGAPRQADIRRAISSAYYAAFHATLAAVADQFIGVAFRNSPQYALAYRAVDHRDIRDLCDDLLKPTIPAKYGPYLPLGGFAADIFEYVAATSELQERRHAADYDPAVRLRITEAQLSIRLARHAVLRLAAATSEQRRAFTTLLVFPPRR
ncbi:MAG: hypothetical protein ACYC0C_12150 [Devosia sp.]